MSVEQQGQGANKGKTNGKAEQDQAKQKCGTANYTEEIGSQL